MIEFGRILIILGVTLVLCGAIILIVHRFFPFMSSLPGDIRINRENFTLFAPFGTMLLVSILGTILLNIVMRFFK